MAEHMYVEVLGCCACSRHGALCTPAPLALCTSRIGLFLRSVLYKKLVVVKEALS